MDALERNVAGILSEVREKGDKAVAAFTKRFDGLDLEPARFRVAETEITRALDGLDGALKRAFKEAAHRIRAYHEETKPADHLFQGPEGELLGELWRPLESVGIYAPGGRAAYPSSVLMAAIPAQVAGVGRIAVTSPPGRAGISPLVLAACGLIGIDEVYQLGGVQAVGAFAYGTSTISAVQKIAGPGNAYVTCAKKLLYGTVGIDLLAGPSEVVVVCDAAADPTDVALELLAQAEHDPATRVFCITSGTVSVDAIRTEIEKQLPGLPPYVREVVDRPDVFRPFPDYATALEEANRIAPEHLSLKLQDPFAALALVKSAGVVMLGAGTPVAFGDYFAGPSHVLPTDGKAAFSSGLSTRSFMKSIHVVAASDACRRKWGGAVADFARAEGLEAHARSAAPHGGTGPISRKGGAGT